MIDVREVDEAETEAKRCRRVRDPIEMFLVLLILT